MKRLGMMFLTVAAGFCLTATVAGALDPYEVTIQQIDSTTMEWLVNQDFGAATLRVTGPKHYAFESVVEGGSIVAFNIFDGSGDPRDGTYRWSLSYVSPIDSALEAAIQEARDAENVCFIDEITEQGIFASGTWSGTFLLLEGTMIVPEASGEQEQLTVSDSDLKTKVASAGKNGRPLPTKDQVILDDLIVDGSACIGFDCVNGESFGFDTVRLKEHNLRLKFLDTSTAASFPSNDWQLTANDSANGGANKFSIDDISGGRTPFTIEARAPSHSLYVDDGGRVGLGTSTPSVHLHVRDGNSPTLRLEQNTSSGFDPKTWDLAGNESNFFVREITSGGSALPFRIQPGAKTNTLFLSEDSFVGIGTSSPQQHVHVVHKDLPVVQRVLANFENKGFPSIQLTNSDAGEAWVFTNKTSGFEISKNGSGAVEMKLDGSGNLTIRGQLTTATMTYPDYVFKDDYELMPLDDLARFIEQNGHLPNIQSEQEVGFGKAVNISQLQVGLLEKVEELTLYTLAQHEAEKELRRQNQALLEAIEKQNELNRRLEARLAALEAAH